MLRSWARRILFSQPSYHWEFPLAHAVNFLIYLGSLACFDFLLWELLHDHRRRRTSLAEQGLTTFPEWCWLCLGYPLFIWTSLDLIGLHRVTPDLCVASCLYLASALVLRVRQNPGSRLRTDTAGDSAWPGLSRQGTDAADCVCSSWEPRFGLHER